MAFFSTKHHFVVEPTAQGGLFRLIERKRLAGDRPIPVDDWHDIGDAALLPGIGRLQAWLDDGVAVREGDGVVVPHAALAGLDDGAARSIGLPPPTPFVYDLGHAGTLDRPEFRFTATWRNTGGQPQPGVRRIGAFLKSGSNTWRLPQPLFDLAEAVDAFNAVPTADMDERFRIWGRMRAQLPDESQRSIELDGYLKGTKIAHAARFSLSLTSGADGFRFAPVLFGPESTRPRDPQDDEEETGSPEEARGILPPAKHEEFVGKRFPAAGDCKARYALNEGWYVVIDEPLRRALTVVRKAQQGDRDQRRQFARNPRAFVRTALGEDADEALVDRLFVETAEYSDRVKDVALWAPKVVPWVKRPTEPWLPETCGVWVGGRPVPIEREQLPEVRDALDQAIQAGEPSVRVAGVEVPATRETLAAVEELARHAEPQPSEPSPPPEQAATESPPDAEVAAEPEREAVESSDRRQPVILEISDNLAEAEFSRSLHPRCSDEPDGPPDALVTTPKPHQDDGIRWLQQRWRQGMPGVLLADDMGLGKTLQALAFLAWLKAGMAAGRTPRRPFLIVAPTGLLKNWQEEHDRHLAAPGLGRRVDAFGAGLKSIRTAAGTETDVGRAVLDQRKLTDADWVLTTYETMRDFEHSFAAVRFAAIVFDEAQKIKAPDARVTDAAKALNGDFIILMTGTPIENRLADLWCIVDTAFPGRLGDLKTFSQTYEKEESPARFSELKTLLIDDSDKALMLRRMKADHLPGLPQKHQHVETEIMPDAQAEAYDRAVRTARTSAERAKMLKALHEFRGISLHPLRPDDAASADYLDQSARFRLAFRVLDRLHKAREKALIFLEDLAMQSFLAAVLQRRYGLARQPMLINGGVEGGERQKRVNEFQAAPDSFDVMILSPRAGGVGLTLTAANHVIHLSRWWNPAVEDQCTDRVYRIGQERDVHVYCLLAIHPTYGEQSFDRRLHDLLERKRALSREMLMPPLGPNDAETLFRETVAVGGGQPGS